MSAAAACAHELLRVEAVDQTLGLACEGCGEPVAHCWRDEHIPERLWNRACANDPKANRCEQDRDDVCALCDAEIDKTLSEYESCPTPKT